jgi:hypothetical protein
MPVQETVDAVAELSAAGFGVGTVIVNLVREPLVDEALLARAGSGPARVAEQVRADLTSVGVKATKATVAGLLSQAHDHAERVALERDLTAEVTAQGLPTLSLPALTTGVEDGGITVLADALTAQGVR